MTGRRGAARSHGRRARRAAPVALPALVALVAGCGGAAPRPGPPELSVAARSPAGAAAVARGFAAGPGRVVTVEHVLEGGGGLSVRDAAGRRLAARVVRRDPRRDLALLAVPGLRAPTARLAAATAGEPVSVRGRAAAVRRRITAEVAAADGSVAERGALELTAGIAPGDSGAPVVARDGTVAGVVFARAVDRPRTAYAVDAASVAALLRAG